MTKGITLAFQKKGQQEIKHGFSFSSLPKSETKQIFKSLCIVRRRYLLRTSQATFVLAWRCPSWAPGPAQCTGMLCLERHPLWESTPHPQNATCPRRPYKALQSFAAITMEHIHSQLLLVTNGSCCPLFCFCGPCWPKAGQEGAEGHVLAPSSLTFPLAALLRSP